MTAYKTLIRVHGEDVILDAGNNDYETKAVLEWPTPDERVGNAFAERPQPYLVLITADLANMVLAARQEITIRGQTFTAVSDPVDDALGLTRIDVRGTL